MRCEICGAPFSGSADETTCERCQTHQSFKKVPRSVAPPPPAAGITQPAGSVMNHGPIPSNVPLHAASTIDDPMDRSLRLSRRAHRTESVRPLSATEQPSPRVVLPLPDEHKHSSMLPSSVVLEGKYRLLNELGRGAMGTVFLAEDTMLKRKVAVKFLLPELADSNECAIRFKHEAIAMASIRNENVAQIYAYGEDNGTPYFVMEYLDGETVEHLIDSHNRRGFFVPVDDVVDIMVQTLYGLIAIHKADAIHRDIKPGNIMLTVDPVRSVIMDFGLARDVQLDDDMRTLAGTPAYIAPELIEGRPGTDRSRLVDIYSLGTTFYELLTGSIPFTGDSWIEILQKHITAMPDYPSSRRRGLPEVFDEIVLRAISKDPKERYQSCDEFLDVLLDVQDLRIPHERRPSMEPPPGRGSNPATQRRSSRSRISSSPKRAIRSTPSGARGRLLIADANETFRSHVMDLCKSVVPGSRVHSTTDGLTALEMLRTLRPHVFIVDTALPGMNGFEIIATVSNDPDFSRMTVIVVSSTGGARDAALFKSLGVHHFLTTPVDMENLAELIRPRLEMPSGISVPSGSPF